MLHAVLKGEMDTVRNLIDRMASTQPELAFLISPETGRVVTFGGLQRAVPALMRAVSANGRGARRQNRLPDG